MDALYHCSKSSGAYTESFDISPELMRICYINPVPSTTGGVNRAILTASQISV